MRWGVGILLAVVVASALYLTSAVISIERLVQAARVGNAAEVLERTNMERLRRSLVDQIISAYLERTGRKDKPLGRLLAQTYGASIADAMLQKMLTADNLTKLLQTGTVAGPNVPTSIVPNVLSINTSNIAELLGRVRWVKPVEFAVRTSQTADRDNYSAVSFHFEGSSWKLSGIDLPRSVVRQLAASLPAK
ncbi:DUF2939 domain-containing protein [Bradyrhizobium guangzhouense]|uniref:DUF2939 domain-containing protein n=1 Tax=Bradyrhizobium guangzhouense TaxID=1325095 RepID=A0AAE6C624_9BRAD|nr:DUF2939 domain-containing protein [Bradyrhizobium guangzhouense]QAU44199.1 hypothetical protein XH91_01725 [Bradyrhizobium guangzhouense]